METSHLWLLLTAAYGLLNTNGKWQVQSDRGLLDYGLVQSKHVPQLFFKRESGKLVLIGATVVDDLKDTGAGNRYKALLDMFNSCFKLGTLNSGPGKLRFFGISTIQNEDSTVATDADDKLEAFSKYIFTGQRRRECDDELNAIEKTAFASVNSSLGWIGMAASPLCSFYESYSQQKAPQIKISHLIEQINILRKLKKLNTKMSYPRPTDDQNYDLNVLVFSDASRTDENGELGILT